jgi:hypothetical protein
MDSSLSNPSVPAASGSAATPSLRNLMKRKKKDGSSSDSQEEDEGAPLSNSTINLTRNWPRFWIIASKQGNPEVTSISPFVIDKTLQGCIGTAKTIKKLRSGVLLVEVSREAQAVSLQRLTMIASIPVTVTPHRSMNSCKGVVRSYDLAQMDDAELLGELQSQNVTEVRGISVTKDGVRRRTNTTILTFAQPSIPHSLKAGYLSVPVEQYFPNPLRCFKCQKYGHHQTLCKHPAACARCGQAAHGDDPCTGPPHCVNCSGSHTSFDKTCSKWLHEKEITKVKFSQNISFPDARKVVEGCQPTQGRSFAAVVAAKVTKSMGTQTEVVRCTCQGRSAPVAGLPTSPTRNMDVQTDVEADDLPGISQAPKPVEKPSSPRLSGKAATIVAENKARLVEKQAAASAAKQAGLAKLGGKPSSLPVSAGTAQGGARPKTPGHNFNNNKNQTSKDTGSEPARAPKGSQDPISNFNRFSNLSQESMDSLDPIDLPEAASGGASGRGRRIAGSKKPT